MPHDKNGNLLGVGDSVIVRGTVKAVFEGEEYCNLNLEIAPLYPNKEPYNLTLNTKQVEKE